MLGFRKFLNWLPSWLKVSFIVGGLGNVMDLWHKADARERGILLLVFAPMFLSLVGLLFSIASFVLFVLPSFILRLLGWGLLTALFGAGGRYCYAHITGRASPDSMDSEITAYTDVEFREAKTPSATKRASKAKLEAENGDESEDEVRKIRRSKRSRRLEEVDAIDEGYEPDDDQETRDNQEGQGGARATDDLGAIRQRWSERVKGKG